MRGIWNYAITAEKERDNCRTVALDNMNSERSVFDLFEYPLVGTRISIHGSKEEVTERCVRWEASV